MPNPKPTIRIACTDDLASIVAINQEAQESPWSAQQLANAISGAETVWVRTIMGKVSAFLIWHSVLDEAEIYHFGVAAAAQRQGLASELLLQLFRHCQAHAIDRIFLEVRSGNHPAKALYLKHGFIINGQRKNYYQTQYGPEDAILMEKTC